MKIPFSPPDICELEIEEVIKVLRSGWITTGPKTKELESKIAALVGTEYSVCLNSQTACSEMTLRLLGVGQGDEVITSAYTYTASASVVCHVGAKLVLIDTQQNSLEMDYQSLENSITEKTKVIIPVDIGGIPCDYNRVFEIVERKKHLFKAENELQAAFGRIIILSDAAHAFGAKRNGVMVGNIADFTSFSFHAVKNLTTAEGGCLTWKNINGINNADIYYKFQLLSLHGQSKDALNKNKPGIWEYDIVAPMYKCNMTDVAAAIGIAQFERYPKMLERRKEIIEYFDLKLKPLGIKVLPHYTDDNESSGHLYITRIFDKNGNAISDETRRAIIIKMAEVGISCNVHYKPLPMHTAYKNLGFDIKNYPNAFAQYENEITLPLHTCLINKELEYIIENYIRIIKAYVN